LKRILNELVPTGRILHLAHSGGAILTYLAAKHHLTSAEKERIDVATFGGGRSITKKYFKGSLTNYYSQNDPLLLVDGRANKLAKMSPPLTTTHYEVRDRKHNTVFIFLPGLTNNPINDHSMEGPTYHMALQLEIQAFQERILHLIKIDERERNIIRLSRKRIANMTGMHHFWDNTLNNISESVRVVRKQTAKFTNLRGIFSGKYRNANVTDNYGVSILDTSVDIANTTNASDTISTEMTIYNESISHQKLTYQYTKEKVKQWISIAREKLSNNTIFISNTTSIITWNSTSTWNSTVTWFSNIRKKLKIGVDVDNKTISEAQLLDIYSTANITDKNTDTTERLEPSDEGILIGTQLEIPIEDSIGLSDDHNVTITNNIDKADEADVNNDITSDDDDGNNNNVTIKENIVTIIEDDTTTTTVIDTNDTNEQ
jgi:hypothetical protein